MAEKKTKYNIQFMFQVREVEGVIKEFDECPNEQFGFRKTGPGWTVDHIRSGKEVTKGKTMKAATDKLLEIFTHDNLVETIHNAIDYETEIKNRKKATEKWDKLSKEFKQITGITLPLDYFLSGLTGIKTVDVIKLDKLLRTPDGISTSDFLTKKYGKRANEIVDELIK